jgi:hypothetical protein
VIIKEDARSVIHCDRCPVRLDLGPSAIVSTRMRLPSGWLQATPDHHLCPTCARKEIEEFASNKAP